MQTAARTWHGAIEDKGNQIERFDCLFTSLCIVAVAYMMDFICIYHGRRRTGNSSLHKCMSRRVSPMSTLLDACCNSRQKELSDAI